MKRGFKNIIILFFVSVLTSDFAFAQNTPAKKDSTKLYENIESFSKRHRFTKFLYRMTFKPTATVSQKKNVHKKGYKKLIQKPYSAFEGKTIRFIKIETLDPFGYSLTDTSVKSQNFFFRAGNSLHIKSQQIAIRNLLLIRQNQPFDSLLVKESERLVRSREYIHDVSFFIKATSINSDSVDIFIRVLDNWSLIPIGPTSISNPAFHITDKNFIGFGHKSDNRFGWYDTTNTFAYNINYYIPNIRNTYINSTIHFSKDQYENSLRTFAVDRPFFSPFAKWAAGINFTQFQKDTVYTVDPLLEVQRYKFNSQDYWAGNAIQIFKGNTENQRTTNFISAIRFIRIRYAEKPGEMYDPQHLFADEDFYLASIGISTRNYVQDKYIFRYGITEDVPIGRVYNLTGGYHVKNNAGRFYLGMRFSSGYYHEWGYLSSNLEYGTFIRASQAEQGIFYGSVNYFTGLFEIGKWKFRQIVKPQVTLGINRFSTDSLTLNEGYGINGFNSTALSGTSRLMITLQTQSYAPWNFIGFHFGPFLVLSLGMLGDEITGLNNSKVYSQIGLGVLIRNEHLVFSTFQLSIAFYPSIPGKGQNVFKINSFKTTDFGLHDFEIGKPAVMQFE